MHIGTTYIGCPTVADDIALVANSATDLQLMLNVANSYANREKYVIHPEKSTILMKIPPKRSNTTSSDWKLGDNEVSVSKTTTHLGIIRSEKNEVSINIDDRISCATKTLYSLTGTGFHGTNGLPPTTCMKLFITYVLPRLLYGLETFVLKQYHLNALEKFYINFLRKIQCLPNRSVKGITYLLLGVRPATAELHIRQLNLLGCIIRSENLTLNKILRRQISTKSETSDSWFTYIDKLLVQYDLPSAAKMVINPPCKLLWKKNVKLAIDKFWTQKLLLDCQNKSTLSYCDLSSLKIGTVHKLWSSIESNIKDVRRGGIKARLITGTYVLQSNTSKFNQHEVSSVCPLCQYEDEDIVHFILKCNALFKYRKSYIEELEVIINSISNPNTCSWNSLIGAGTSLPGIVAAKCEATVILSDSSEYPQCLANCAASCEANNLSNITIVGIKWGQFTPELLNLQPVDIILGSDCFFDTKDFEDIIVTVAFIMKKRPSTEFWCTYQERRSVVFKSVKKTKHQQNKKICCCLIY
ncbi:Hypothetical predicted protein [Mytilus galloprovincialis]|uniref:Reverse transcriptase zinc-binding domain-containing protein n=1 Tax=Mytilus galloprovincialis TaxID=29158 RepID=A0A8B6BS57_MYTGA|nr:Hypothetical predicted protein [Mytilus galloprovincialis]